MKGQLRGKGRLKGLLLAHGEKIGMALVAVVVLWMVYVGLGREKLEVSKQPEQLTQRARAAEENISRLTYQQLPEEKKLTPVDYRPASVMKEIELGKYRTERPLNPPEFPQKTKRNDPQLVPLEELEIHGGVGLWAMVDPTGGQPGRGVVGRGTPSRGERDEGGIGRPSRGRAAATRTPSRTPRRGAARGETGGYGPPGGARGGYGEDDGYSDARGVGGGGVTAPLSLTEILPQGGVRISAMDKVQAHYWAVVLAKVPLTKQLEAYRRVFRDAESYDPQYDSPEYYGYVIQRAEISGDGSEPKWKTVKAVNETALMKVTANWGGGAEPPPVIDQRYYDPVLTFPLPPLVGRDWEPAEVKHSDVPEASLDGLYGEGYLDGQGEEPGKEGEVEVDEHGFSASAGPLGGPGMRGNPRGGGYGSRGGGYGSRGGYGDEGGGIGRPSGRGGPPGGGRSRGGYGEERGGYGEERGGYGAGIGRPTRGGTLSRGRPTRGQSSRGRTPQGGGRGGYGEGGYGGYGMQMEEIPFAMFRFFDTTVQPGHRYQYRVRLALHDPNAEVEAKYLSDAVAKRLDAEKKRREARKSGGTTAQLVFSDWSDASPVVIIPFAGQVFAGPVKYVAPDRRSRSEPTAKVIVKMLDDKEGVEGVAERESMRRGTVANFKQATDVVDYSDMRPTLRKIDDFEFVTNSLLVDVYGGGRVSKTNRDMTEPGEMLLLDHAGRLVVRAEMGDAEQYQQLRAVLDAAAAQNDASRARPGTGRGGYGEGGYGEGRGGYGEDRGGEGIGRPRGGAPSRGRPTRGQSSRGGRG